MVDVLVEGKADAVLAASIFPLAIHGAGSGNSCLQGYSGASVGGIAETLFFLEENGIPVRNVRMRRFLFLCVPLLP